MCYLQRKQATGSSEAQRTNLPTLPRTSKKHSRRKEGSGSLLRSLKCIWQGLERGTSRKTTEDRCALQDVHVDPALPVCKDCPSKTWWHSQQKSLPSWRSTTGRCSVPHTVSGLHQWYPYHYIKEGLKHNTCRRPGNLECVWAQNHCNLQDPRSHQWYQQVDTGLGPRDKY